jgi:hypothetical protein
MGFSLFNDALLTTSHHFYSIVKEGPMTSDKGYKIKNLSYCMDIDFTEAAKQINGNRQTFIHPKT